jgi:hypothetical protein
MEDSRSLHELANDLPAYDVLDHHAFDPHWVHAIIQSCRAARARLGRKPAAERGRILRDELAHEHVRPLRAPAEAALPHQLCAFARIVRLQRRSEHLV